jgi:hypothetical protein
MTAPVHSAGLGASHIGAARLGAERLNVTRPDASTPPSPGNVSQGNAQHGRVKGRASNQQNTITGHTKSATLQSTKRAGDDATKSDESNKAEQGDFESILRDCSSDDASQGEDANDTDVRTDSKTDADSSATQSAKTNVVLAPIEVAITPRQVLPFTLAIPRTTEAQSNQSSINTMATSQNASAGLLSNDDVEDTESDATQTAKPKIELSAPPIDTTPDSASKGELAFAAKLTPNAPQSTSDAAPHAQEKPKPTAAATRAPMIPQVSADSIEPEGPRPISASEPAIKPAAAFIHDNAAHTSPTSKIEIATPTNSLVASARLEEVIELRPAPPTSASDITVRIADADRGTDVRFVERGGEVHVSVKTSDSEVAQSLRSGLTDFAARLEQGGMKAEMWKPSSDDSNWQNQSDRRSGEQRNSQRERADASQEDANQNSKKPKWVEALELSIGRQS